MRGKVAICTVPVLVLAMREVDDAMSTSHCDQIRMYVARADRGATGGEGERVVVIAREMQMHLSTERPVRHGSNATRPSSSSVPNKVTLCIVLAAASVPDIRPSRLFGPPQTRTGRTGNNEDGSFYSPSTALKRHRSVLVPFPLSPFAHLRLSMF